jgi:type VI secretion system protein ImpK
MLSMHALLRDTALEVSMLANGDGETQSAYNLRESWMTLVKNFDKALTAQHVSDNVRKDAVYAQCGLLDETALRYLPYNERSEWDAQPLQVEHFGNHDAGERVYERLEIRLRERPTDTRLLQCYAVVLGLGFLGRYAHHGEHRREELLSALNERIGRVSPRDIGFVINTTGRTRLDEILRLSPWVIAGIGCAAAALLWIGFAHSLNVQLANLPRLKP